jgi:hypothetical protein
MEQKTKITSLQELIDWFNDTDSCYISEQYDDGFVIATIDNSTLWQIDFNPNDSINDIIYETIKKLENFDADDYFTELWSFEFAKLNNFTPLQFITMLKDDEATFKELAENLADVWRELRFIQ